MRIMDLRKGRGPDLAPPGVEMKFRRGDNFLPVGGEHGDHGRTVVLGVGSYIVWESDGYRTRGALLMRCQGCLKSYVL